MQENELHEMQLRVLQQIQEDLKIIAQRDKDSLQLLNSEVAALKMIVTGPDGQNGLRSYSRKHDTELDNLKRWQTQFMAIFAVIQLIGVPVAIYIITHWIK